MLQRIQTVYLLAVVALIATMFFLPLASFQLEGLFYTFDVAGVNTAVGEPELIYATWGLFGLAALIALIALVTIFLYKKRVLQIRLSVFNVLLMIGFYAVFFFFVRTFKNDMGITAFSVKFALSLPLISMILSYLAIRNIGADEALVRSLNRLR